MKIRNQTTLYFIRHGQTPSNEQGIQQGDKIDDYLDTQGIIQIEHLAELVKHLNLDILFTSYLHRAEETAALIERHLPEKISLLHDFRLRERDFGSLTGKTERQMQAALPGWKEKDFMQQYDYSPFGGENVDEVRQRSLGAILDIANNYHHQNIGVITHAGIIRLLLFHFPEITRLYQGKSKTENSINNTDIYEWEVNEDTQKNIKSLLK